MLSLHAFYVFLVVMAVLAVVVFFSLYHVDAGYGKFYGPKWGPSLNNRLGYFVGNRRKEIPARYRDAELERRLWNETERLI